MSDKWDFSFLMQKSIKKFNINATRGSKADMAHYDSAVSNALMNNKIIKNINTFQCRMIFL